VTLAEVWRELEARAPQETSGRMVQRIWPDSEIDLFATLELSGGPRARRALELQVAEREVQGFDAPEGTGQVESRVERRPGARAALVLSLLDPGADDLFAEMCEGIARVTAAATSEATAISAWTGRFAKWRRLLRGGARPLSPERQRGLYAELRSIRDLLIPSLGFDEAVRAWKGPEGGARDFETRGCAVEVKASAANEPQVVSINGERQLDDAGLRALVLVHDSLEILRDAGETLPALVAELRRLGDGRADAGTLEDRLLQSGYADAHAAAYRRIGYAVRRTSLFGVRNGFPRITEGQLMDGVGSVRYRLAVDSCREFEIRQELLAELLEGSF
jgi:hypothetical protein